MTTRRALLRRLPLVAAGGFGLWLVRDRLPWPGPGLVFARGAGTGWIPLEAADSLIQLTGHVGGVAIRIVVDSGAQFSAIDRALATRLKLPQTVALPLIAYGVSGKASLARTVTMDLDLPGLSIRGMRAAALDVGRLAEATGRDFSMLLGRDVLRRLVLDADLPRARAALHAPDSYRPPLDARVVPLKLIGGAPVLTVRVDGHDVDVLIDTGSTGSLALSTPAAKTTGLLAPGRPMFAAHSVSLGGLSLDRVVHARSVEAAGVTLRNTPVQIYEPATAPIPAGLLGIGFLRRFQVALDLAGKRLFLAPPAIGLRRPG